MRGRGAVPHQVRPLRCSAMMSWGKQTLNHARATRGTGLPENAVLVGPFCRASSYVHCVSAFSYVQHCGSASSYMQHCGSASSSVHHCGSASSYVQHCVSASSYIQHCGSASSYVQHCGSASSSVQHCGSASSYVHHWCELIFDLLSPTRFLAYGSADKAMHIETETAIPEGVDEKDVVAVINNFENSIAYLIPGAEATFLATGNEVGAFRTFFHSIPGQSSSCVHQVGDPTAASVAQGRVPYEYMHNKYAYPLPPPKKKSPPVGVALEPLSTPRT